MAEDVTVSIDDLSVAEVVLLAFAVDPMGNSSTSSGLNLAASKEAIIWAICMERFYARHKNSLFEIEDTFDRIVGTNIEAFLRSNTPFEVRTQRSLSPYPVPLSRYAELFGLPRSQVSSANIERFRKAEKRLEGLGLIRDPFTFEVPGGALLILGFIPFEFSIKTEKGNEFAMRLAALAWEASFKKSEAGYEIDGKIKVFDLVARLKKHIGDSAKRIDGDRDG